MSGALAASVAAACRRPWVVLLAGLALTVAAMLYVMANFAMTTDSSALISPEVAWRLDERRLDAAFPANGDAILVVVDGATSELAEAGAAALTARLARDPAHVRSATRPDGGAFFAQAGLLFGSLAEVVATTTKMIEAQPFLGPLAADPSLRGVANMLATVARGAASGDPARLGRPIGALGDALTRQAAGQRAFFSWQALFGGDAAALAAPTRRLILVRPVLDFGALMPGAAVGDAIRAAAAGLGLDPARGVTVRLTGSVPLADEEFASLADRAWLVGGVMLLAMLTTLWLATRSGRVVAAILATTLAGLALTTALGLAAVGRFNLISVAFIPLFVGLGVDFGIQLGVRFQAERRQGVAVAAAAEIAARDLGPSLLLAAAAVCLGFLAFLPTAYTGIAELGIIAALGMAVALGCSVTLLPALLVLLGPRVPAAAPPAPWLARLDHLLIAKRKAVLWAFGVALAASLAALPLVRFDFNPLNLRAPDGEAMATLAELMRDPDRNPNTIDILVPDLASARPLAARLERLPEVARVLTVESFVPADQPRKLAAIADARSLLEFSLDSLVPAPPPSDRETIAALRAAAAALGRVSGSEAQRLARILAALADGPPVARARAEAMLVPPLAVMLDQLRAALGAAPVTLADVPADLRRDWVGPRGSIRIQLLPRGTDNAALARFTAAVRTVAPHATGVAVATQAAAATVATAFVQAAALALAVISLLLLAALRNLREVAFTLAPVVLSGFLTLATCVVIGQPINFANIIAFPLLFGVGVAFHIYFVMAWRSGATDLLQSSLARGVSFSALATGTAFGSLWLSSHPGTASMGEILLISLAWTLVCALIFEPALLGPQRSRR